MPTVRVTIAYMQLNAQDVANIMLVKHLDM